MNKRRNVSVTSVSPSVVGIDAATVKSNTCAQRCLICSKMSAYITLLYMQMSYIYITILKISSRIYDAFGRNNSAIVECINLSKAFDIINHLMLLKTENYGIHGNKLPH